MRPITLTKTLAAASDNTIALNQTLAGAGNFTINGASATAGVATLDTARRVILTSAGDDHLITFTVYGYPTSAANTPIQETVKGTNGGVAATTLDFFSITRVSASGATAGNVRIGTNSTGSTPWVSVTPHVTRETLSVASHVTGTVTYSVEYSYKDVNYNPTSTFGAYQLDYVSPTPWLDPVVQGQTGDTVAKSTEPIWAARVTITSGTGSVEATFLQSGIAGPH
jgi:hypothetical protein